MPTVASLPHAGTHSMPTSLMSCRRQWCSRERGMIVRDRELQRREILIAGMQSVRNTLYQQQLLYAQINLQPTAKEIFA